MGLGQQGVPRDTQTKWGGPWGAVAEEEWGGQNMGTQVPMATTQRPPSPELIEEGKP